MQHDGIVKLVHEVAAADVGRVERGAEAAAVAGVTQQDPHARHKELNHLRVGAVHEQRRVHRQLAGVDAARHGGHVHEPDGARLLHDRVALLVANARERGAQQHAKRAVVQQRRAVRPRHARVAERAERVHAQERDARDGRCLDVAGTLKVVCQGHLAQPEHRLERQVVGAGHEQLGRRAVAGHAGERRDDAVAHAAQRQLVTRDAVQPDLAELHHVRHLHLRRVHAHTNVRSAPHGLRRRLCQPHSQRQVVHRRLLVILVIPVCLAVELCVQTVEC
mmetsp:Transcript_41947/g.125549  ORF Transcript_41947/g.125549 Transcript_41947/m.125549 type:complete len:277 (+) Transcript_41947:183-1013(+)